VAATFVESSILINACRHARFLLWWRRVPRPHLLLEGSRLLNAPFLKPGIYVYTMLLLLILSVGVQDLNLFAMVAVALVSFFRPLWAMALLPCALLWSPRLNILFLGDEFLFLRLDHALVLGAACHLFMNDAPHQNPQQDRHEFKLFGMISVPMSRCRPLNHPVHAPWLFLLILLCVSTLAGFLQHTLASPEASLMYILHWIYFLLLFTVAFSLGRHLKVVGIYAWVIPILAAACYGLLEIRFPFYERPHVVYRSFERILFEGQANHFGILFSMSAVLGVSLVREHRFRVLGVSLALLSTCALSTTGSRTGWIAWIVAMAVLAMLWWPVLRYTFPLLALTGMLLLPQGLWQGFTAPGSSMFDRLIAWKSALSTVPAYPLLGLGTGARHRSFYDNQYIMTLAENGLPAVLLLLFILAILARSLHQARSTPGISRALCSGTLAALAGVAVSGLTTVSLIVTVVAGPLLWICGVALSQAEDDA
jgi:hypothetical protein